jgi:hypothetical protein
MSLVSMVDTKLARDEGYDPDKPSPSQPIGVSTDLVNQITRWIPTETITVYVALLPLLAPLAQHDPSYHSRWVLFGVIAGSNPLIVILLTMAKTPAGQGFSLPWFEMVVAPVAFAAWAFALPDTPLNSVVGYDIKWNAAILTITTTGITLIANALHKSPDFDQVMTKQQGANPKSPSPAG